MLCVVRIWIGLEPTAQNSSRCSNSHILLIIAILVLGNLRRSISDNGIQMGMDKFGVVFMQDLLLNDGGILVQLRVLR